MKTRSKEHELQKACMTWFRLQYPHLKRLLFAIPNGGWRGAEEAKRFKAEGVVAGVSDLFLAVPIWVCVDECVSGLFIELKVKPNKPTQEQLDFMKDAENVGYKTAVIYCVDDFITLIKEYLNNQHFTS